MRIRPRGTAEDCCCSSTADKIKWIMERIGSMVTGVKVNGTDYHPDGEGKVQINLKSVGGQSLLGTGDISVLSSTEWGDITGTLADQTDLKDALDTKLDEPETAGTAGQVLKLNADLEPVWANESGGGGSVEWGDIGGTLADQTDLANALAAKADSTSLATVATTGDYDDLTDKPDLALKLEYVETITTATVTAYPPGGRPMTQTYTFESGYSYIIYGISSTDYVNVIGTRAEITPNTTSFGYHICSAYQSNSNAVITLDIYRYKSASPIVRVVGSQVRSYQVTLQSGISIKTVGGNSLLGSGDVPFPTSFTPSDNDVIATLLGCMEYHASGVVKTPYGNLDSTSTTITVMGKSFQARITMTARGSVTLSGYIVEFYEVWLYTDISGSEAHDGTRTIVYTILD